MSAQQEGREARNAARTGALVPLADWTRRMSPFWDTKRHGLEDLLRKIDQ